MPVNLSPAVWGFPWISRQKLVVNPRYAKSLHSAGLRTPNAIINLPGEVLSGHADRHVVTVQVDSRRAILKREHRVKFMTRLRSWLAGYGWSSLSEREARVLDELDRSGVPVPKCMAYGESDGRAFVLLRRNTGRDLREVLRTETDCHQRRAIARNVGKAVAAVLRAGFAAPDLTAKHILVLRDCSIMLLDWPRACRRRTLDDRTISAALAPLHASLAQRLATSRERILVLRTCLHELAIKDSLKIVARAVERRAKQLLRRRSIREQQSHTRHRADQRIRWVAGEQLCVTRPMWRLVKGCVPTWLANCAHETVGTLRIRGLHVERVGDVRLTQFPPAPRWRQVIARILGQQVRSPAILQSGLVFRLARHGIPVGRVLAFGGRPDGGGFLLTTSPFKHRDLRGWLNQPGVGRNRLLRRVGQLARRFHAAGCLGIRGELLSVAPGWPPRLQLNADGFLHRCSRVSRRKAARDLEALIWDLALDRERDKARLLRGYFAGDTLGHRQLRLASEVLSMSRRAA